MAVIGNSPATTGTTVTAQSFNGDASTVAFTLSRSVNSTVDLEVLVDNVQQSPYDSSYSVSGTTLTFSEAPASGTNNIYVIYRGATIATAQVIPDDGSVSTAKLQDTAITSAKLATGVVEGAMTTQIGGRRNIIINGAMQVAQRGTSFTGLTNGTSKTYTVDRFAWIESGSTTATFSVTQEADSPDGFSNSLKISPSTSGSGHNVIEIIHSIEAQNLQHLAFGSSSAKSFTLSFWVKCSQTGTSTVSFYNLDALRQRAENYTINSADTWEYKTITVSGDTSGAFNNDNGVGLTVYFPIAAASSYNDGTTGVWGSYDDGKRGGGMTIDLTGSTSDYLQITGVQLEVGTVATPFEHRSYGEELALCQRYYRRLAGTDVYVGYGVGLLNTTSGGILTYPLVPSMRSAPSVSGNNQRIYDGSANAAITAYNTNRSSTNAFWIEPTTASSSFTIGRAFIIGNNNSSSGYMDLDAEL